MRDRAAALAAHACAPVRIIKLQLWLVAIACMRDETGTEIERQLGAMRDDFATYVCDVALAEHRTWASWRARRLATVLIFLAYLCQRSKYHGQVVWMIRGIPRGALAVATRMRSTRLGREVIQHPCVNTVATDLEELEASGLLMRDQFAVQKVPDWCKGKRKTDDKGRTTQWAFNYYFLTVCPFKSGLQGRIVPAPRGSARPRLRVKGPLPQVVIDAPPAFAAAPVVDAAPKWNTDAPVFYDDDLVLSSPDTTSPDMPAEAKLVADLIRSGLDPSNAMFVLTQWRNTGPDPPDDDNS